MQKPLLVLTVISFFFFSCKKEKTKEPEPTPGFCEVIYINYSHLKPGNYWIYQVFDVDTFGNATPTSRYDSVFAGNDTIINGKTYSVRVETESPSFFIKTYLRDSLDYLVDYNGRIVFSSSSFDKVFRSFYFDWGGTKDTVAYVENSMTDDNETFSVPAGSFRTKSFTETWNMYPAYQNGGKIIKQKTRYNLAVGVVSESLPFNANGLLRQERRLLRYSVK